MSLALKMAAATSYKQAVRASVLMHFDGTNGSTTMTDEYGKTCTAQGNAQISTANSKFGGASLLLDGTGDYVSIQSFSDKVPGSSDFLLECWVMPNSTASIRCIASTRDSATSNGGYAFNSRITEAVGLVVWDSTGTIVVNINASVGALSTAAFTHVGFMKVGTKWGLLVGGSVVATATETGTCGGAGTETFKWGRDATLLARDFPGNIDEGRIVKGTQVPYIYQDALTSLSYTVPTAAFSKG